MLIKTYLQYHFSMKILFLSAVLIKKTLFYSICQTLTLLCIKVSIFNENMSFRVHQKSLFKYYEKYITLLLPIKQTKNTGTAVLNRLK